VHLRIVIGTIHWKTVIICSSVTEIIFRVFDLIDKQSDCRWFIFQPFANYLLVVRHGPSSLFCGAIERRLGHFPPCWLRMGWQNVTSQGKPSTLPRPGIEPGPRTKFYHFGHREDKDSLSAFRNQSHEASISKVVKRPLCLYSKW